MSLYIEGWDYVSMTKVSHTRATWLELLDHTVALGGRRRVEKGETFAHDAMGSIRFEVYANISAPVVDDVSDLL
jgi:hypothetical protein